MTEKWRITLNISRQKGTQKRTFQSFPMEVDPDEYILDAIERVWAFHDRSLVYRHACHHSTCGACAMLVNGVEKLTCITTIRSIAQPGATIRVEPLKNFPVVSDLMVDMSRFYNDMDETQATQVTPVHLSGSPNEKPTTSVDGYERLVDCIECGMCVSACPAANTSDTYLGPGVLASIHLSCMIGNEQGLIFADSQDGLWRCHSGFECSEVCPSNVDPASRIMALRRQVIIKRVKRFLKL